MSKVLIVGSGLFGSVFARQCAEDGHECLVIDKRDHIGGNCYTKKSATGIDVHMYGPHIFHTNDKFIWDWVNKFAEFEHTAFSPVANNNGKVYSLPFNMWTFNQLWGVSTAHEAKEKIKSQSYTLAPKNSLKDHAISSVGKTIYNKLIKGYTKKQWGVDPSELPASIIKRLPLRFEWDSRYFDDKYEGIPINGYTSMIENILDHENIKVQLNTCYLKNKDYLDKYADTVVYTGPIDAYFNYSEGDLNYRSLRWEHGQYAQDVFQGCAVMNYTDEDTPYTRVIEHKLFLKANRPKTKSTVVSVEYPDEYYRGKEAYYPCYDEESKVRYSKYKEMASKEKNVIFGGRLAEYKYYDMHQVIASALNKSKKFLSDANKG
jgi:UDP-galactopyranose mutase